MSELLSLLLPVLLVAVGTFAVSAFVLLRSNISAGWKALAIPAAFVGAVIIPLIIAGAVGRSLPAAQLPDRIMVLAHKTIIQDGKKKRIEVWGVQPKDATRLYSVPYNKSLEKQLEKAAGGRARGLQSELHRKHERKMPKPGEEDEGDFGLDFKRPEDMMQPKDGDSSPPPPKAEDLLKPQTPGMTV